jgi:hypothetical protein
METQMRPWALQYDDNVEVAKKNRDKIKKEVKEGGQIKQGV